MRRAAVLVALAGALLGCSGELPSPPIVDRFRLLAVRATPPEVAPGDSAAFDLLLVDPQAGRPRTYLWAACVTAPGESSDACVTLVTAGLPAAGLAACDASLTGGGVCLAGDAAAAALAIPADFLAAGAATRAVTMIVVAATGATDAVDCALAVGSSGTLLTDCEIAVKSLVVSTAAAPNQNPELADLTIDGVDLAADGSSTATGGTAHALVATAADGAAESYTPAGGTATTESLLLTWYLMNEDPAGGTPGTFSDFRTEIGGDAESWTTPITAARVALWAVVQDGRGGVGWIAREATVLAVP